MALGALWTLTNSPSMSSELMNQSVRGEPRSHNGTRQDVEAGYDYLPRRSQRLKEPRFQPSAGFLEIHDPDVPP